MRYTHAILARIPEKLKAAEKKTKLNIEGMRKQQEDLAETLRESGLKIIDIDTAEGSSVHGLMVDDAAVMINGTALITQPKDEGLNIGEIAKILAGLSWNVVECPSLLNGKPVILHGSDVLFTGREIFVGIRKHATNMEGAICLGGVFCDLPVIPIHMHEKSHPLKYYISIAAPNILAVGKGKEAQSILRTMEQEATFMYQIITIEDEEAVASLCVNARTIFRQDRTDQNFTNLQRAGMQLWALDMAELVKAGQPFTNYCLLIRELNQHDVNLLKEN